MFNLKTPEGLKTFRGVAEDIAALVKKYNGSLSGEHGDGRLRGEFIPFMVGEECFAMMRKIKETFDPQGDFQPRQDHRHPADGHEPARHPGHPESAVRHDF